MLPASTALGQQQQQPHAPSKHAQPAGQAACCFLAGTPLEIQPQADLGDAGTRWGQGGQGLSLLNSLCQSSV